jgi:hypothetical protein
MKKDISEIALEKINEGEFLRSQMAVSTLDYKNSIERLASLASSYTGGSSAAAQVLLSCYNKRNWQLDVMELGLLDYKHLQDAFIVMRGWLFLREYPHNVIENGEQIFSALENQWQSLHVEKRYASHYRK